MQRQEESQRANRPSSDANGAIDSFTEGYIKKCVRQQLGNFGITDSDRDDLEQELRLKLAKHLPYEDPDAPEWKAFVALTLTRCIENILRNRRAQKRDFRRVSSIHIVIGQDEEGPVELADTIHEVQHASRLGQRSRSAQQLAELVIDVAACISELPDERHREACERLKTDSISQVARDMNVPRTTLNSWLRKVRQRFEDKRLKDYL